MAVERNRPDHEKKQPASLSSDDETSFDETFAQLSQPGWIVYKPSIDRDVIDWFRSRWPDYRSTINQVLRAYLDRKMNVAIAVKEYSLDRVEVVGKYDPDVVQWVESKPNSDGFMSLVLRDFMLGCIEQEGQSKTG